MKGWHLKKSDGAVFGPVDLNTLIAWAADGRIAPDDLVAEDPVHWRPAPELLELGMVWNVDLVNSTVLGPLNLMALRDLLLDGAVLPTARLVHTLENRVSTICDELLPALAAQHREIASLLAAQAEQDPDRARWDRAISLEVTKAKAQWDIHESGLKSRVEELEKQLQAERQAASECRDRQQGAEQAYRDVLGQFRDLNDKYIRLRQEFTQFKSRPT